MSFFLSFYNRQPSSTLWPSNFVCIDSSLNCNFLFKAIHIVERSESRVTGNQRKKRSHRPIRLVLNPAVLSIQSLRERERWEATGLRWAHTASPPGECWPSRGRAPMCLPCRSSDTYQCQYIKQWLVCLHLLIQPAPHTFVDNQPPISKKKWINRANHKSGGVRDYSEPRPWSLSPPND